jgi:hypothetical protein
VENFALVSLWVATFPIGHLLSPQVLCGIDSRENLFQIGESPVSLSVCEVLCRPMNMLSVML